MQFGGMARIVAPAKFKEGSGEGTKLHYSDAVAFATYSHHIGKENVISFQIADQYMRIDWDQNPYFTGSNYNYLDASVGFLSDALEDWRWFLNGGVLVSTDNFNFGHTGVWYGLMWGKAEL